MESHQLLEDLAIWECTLPDAISSNEWPFLAPRPSGAVLCFDLNKGLLVPAGSEHKTIRCLQVKVVYHAAFGVETNPSYSFIMMCEPFHLLCCAWIRMPFNSFPLCFLG